MKTLKIVINSLLIITGAGLLLFPYEVVAILCPNKQIFGVVLGIIGILNLTKEEKQK